MTLKAVVLDDSSGTLKTVGSGGTNKLLTSDSSGGSSWVSLADGGFMWVCNGYHAVGSGAWTIPWVIPYAIQIQRLEYYLGTAGSGTGTPTMELRKGSSPTSGYTAYGNGTIYALGSIVAQTGLSISLSAGDLVWPYITAINATTPAIGCAFAWRGVRQ